MSARVKYVYLVVANDFLAYFDPKSESRNERAQRLEGENASGAVTAGEVVNGNGATSHDGGHSANGNGVNGHAGEKVEAEQGS